MTLENKIKELDNELRGRIRKAEIWIAGAGAVIAAVTTIIGLVSALESKELPITTEVISYAKTS